MTTIGRNALKGYEFGDVGWGCVSGLVVTFQLLLAAPPCASAAEPVAAIAMHGTAKFAGGFDHFDSADPDASKGGRLIQGVFGSFDSVNPFIIKGVPVSGVANNVVESLMARSLDEPFSLYGLIAETLEIPDDRSEVIFNINPKARFSDGHPVTADDVLFSFETLRERGRPNHRGYFKKVAKTERLSDLRVRFVFAGGTDRELPLILGLMPVFPRHLLTPETFEQTTLEPFVGSGPYKMSRIDPGRSISYTRDSNYWGRELPVNRGRLNFDELRFDYYRDNSTMFEAFKSGELNLRFEDDPALWSQGYDFPAVKDGRIVKTEFATEVPAGMTGLVYNTRRSVFADSRVRRAVALLFDFEFANRSLFNGLYKRTQSFFERSVLSSVGRAADEEEQRLLAPFTGSVTPEAMAGLTSAPVNDGTGRNRANLGRALALLADAGFKTDGGQVIDPKTAQPLTFEILVNTQQRVLAGFQANLARIGIVASIRQVDGAQYQARLRTYDYDMIQYFWPASLSPGNEQVFRWSEKAEGSLNYAGVSNPAADAMIAAMLSARDPGAFVSAVRALDRVLLSGDYVIPLYHVPRYWVAHASRLRYPERSPLIGVALDTWWMDKQ